MTYAQNSQGVTWSFFTTSCLGLGSVVREVSYEN